LPFFGVQQQAFVTSLPVLVQMIFFDAAKALDEHKRVATVNAINVFIAAA
jgi:hypothetical protein